MNSTQQDQLEQVQSTANFWPGEQYSVNECKENYELHKQKHKPFEVLNCLFFQGLGASFIFCTSSWKRWSTGKIAKAFIRKTWILWVHWRWVPCLQRSCGSHWHVIVLKVSDQRGRGHCLHAKTMLQQHWRPQRLCDQFHDVEWKWNLWKWLFNPETKWKELNDGVSNSTANENHGMDGKPSWRF